MISGFQGPNRGRGVKALWVPFMLIMGLFGCRDKDPKTPPIPYEKMTAVMSDLQMVEAYTYNQTNKDTSRNVIKVNGRNKDTLVYYYQTVLKHHELAPNDFFTALDWYTEHPSDMDSLYTRMMARMGEWESELSNR